MRLRPPQRAACRAAADLLPNGPVLISSPTGTGKTVMGCALSEAAVMRQAAPVLWVAPTDETLRQAAERFVAAGWVVQIDKADEWSQPLVAMSEAKAGARVVIVASQGTLRMKRRLERYSREGWALCVLDECFPAGTLVDGRPIESLRAGDMVRSYNHNTGRVEQRAVVRTFESQPAQLVTVHLSTGKRLVCTAGHPFFVGQEYRPAINLQHGDAIYGPVRPTAVQGMRSRSEPTENAGEPRARTQPYNLLLGDLQTDVGIPEALGDDGRDEPKTRKCPHAGAQPDAQEGDPGQGDGVSARDGAQAADPWWQRHRTDCDGGEVACCATSCMEGEFRCANEAATEQRLPTVLQAGSGASAAATGHRGGRRQSHGSLAAGSRREENGLSRIAWVDRVEVHERRGTDGFGPLCPGDRVYNIEVAGNHNYFVDDVLVHNCHHSPASTWLGVREHFCAPWLGLTATTQPPGLADLWTEVKAFKGGITEAISDGWLVPVTDHIRYVSMDKEEYQAMRSADLAEVADAVVRPIRSMAEVMGDRQGLTFWPRTLAAAQAAKFMVSPGLDGAQAVDGLPWKARMLSGKMPRAERALAIRQYHAKTLQVLSLCGVGIEGMDIPDASVLGIWRQTESEVMLSQMIGRVMRPLAGVLDGLDEATAEERRDAIARSAKPHAVVVSVASPDMHEKWATPGRLFFGDLPEPVLVDMEARAKQGGKSIAQAMQEAKEAEVERQRVREQRQREHEERLARNAHWRAEQLAQAKPYEMRSAAQVDGDKRRDWARDRWLAWSERAQAAPQDADRATDKQALAIERLIHRYLGKAAPPPEGAKVAQLVRGWDRKTAVSAQYALRMRSSKRKAV